MASESRPFPPAVVRSFQILWTIALLYLFLVGINVLESAITALTGGKGAIKLEEQLSNPFAALAFGVLITVMVQSSSVTTSFIVTWVGTGLISVEAAIPMVMGANIGTSVTSTLVSPWPCSPC